MYIDTIVPKSSGNHRPNLHGFIININLCTSARHKLCLLTQIV